MNDIGKNARMSRITEEVIQKLEKYSVDRNTIGVITKKRTQRFNCLYG
jgi:hypothetical protein